MTPEDGTMDELTQDRDNVLRDTVAQTVHKYLENVENNRAAFRNRWIWELLQNARDAAKSHAATVEATLTDQAFTLRHDGAPFRGKEITHLIYHGSTKNDPTETETIGRFGSGFLITHVLAKNITVTGQYQGHDENKPPEHFTFTLERDGNNATELSDSMDRSWNAFKNAFTEQTTDQRPYTTQYEYPLSSATYPIATAGLNTVDTIGPYTLAFNPKIRELIINNKGTITRRGVPQDAKTEQLTTTITRTPITTSENGTTRQQAIITATNDDVTIAIIIEERNGQTSILPPRNAPRLCIAFPLFGTETFCFPTIINSEDFTPQEKRDSIYLGNDNTPAITNNKNLISTAAALYKELLHCASTQGWQGLYHLAQLPARATYEWLDQEWYEQLLIDKIIVPARHAPILTTTNGTRTPPREANIPIADDNDSALTLYGLSAQLASITHTLPASEERDGWTNVLSAWATILGQDPAEFEEGWTVTKLATHLANLESLVVLQEDLGGNDPIPWLHDLYDLITTTEHTSLFDSLALLPDQNGNLQPRTTLRTDQGINGELKDIAATLDVHARDIILDKRIEHTRIPTLPRFTEEELITHVLNVITSRHTTHAHTTAYRDANIALFTWLIKNGHTDVLDGYPVYTQQHNADEPIMLRLTRAHANAEQRPLAPHALWPEQAQGFVDLFAEGHQINTAYYNTHPNHGDWQRLERQHYLRCDPVYTTAGNDIDLLSTTPLPDADTQAHVITEDVRTIGIAFFSSPKNTSVIDRARNSQLRARQLLHFLVDYAITKELALETVTLTCECGQQHEYYRSGWFRPLKDRKWVPIGEKQHVQPNADVIATLLHEEPTLLRTLAQGPAATITKALNISGSDLLLRIATTTEEERVKLVATALDLSQAVGNDTAKLEAIAQALKDDPNVFGEIEAAAARRNKVRRNQAIGKTVEDALKRLLEAAGLSVTRKHIGHDFEIEHDIIDPDTNQEIAWEITNRKITFLLEVKASTAQHYRMTPKQAETAVDNADRFVLCMVNLPADQEITEEHVLNGARFVPTISEHLDNLWHQLTTLKDLQNAVPTTDGDITLEIEDAQVRFSIGHELWQEGLDFNDGVAYFQQPIQRARARV